MNTFNPQVTLSDSETQALAYANGWEYQVEVNGSMVANPQPPKEFCVEFFSKILKAAILPITVKVIEEEAESQKTALFDALKVIDNDIQVKVADATKVLDTKVTADINQPVVLK